MDRVLQGFLSRQFDDAMALNAASDLVTVLPIDERLIARAAGVPGADEAGSPRHYLARFTCTGLVRSAAGEIVEAHEFHVGVFFASGHVRRVNPFQLVTWLGPPNVFHPNINPPHICIGRLVPGIPLVDILEQCCELISFRKLTMREDDALNRDACVWARRNQSRFPIDQRSMTRRAVDFQLESLE